VVSVVITGVEEPVCVTVRLSLAMLIVAERLLVDELAAIVKPTLPLPLPPGAPIVTHAAPLPADQIQPAPTVTVTVPDPPAFANACGLAAAAYVHGPLNVKMFDQLLRELPVGPITETCASYAI